MGQREGSLEGLVTVPPGQPSRRPASLTAPPAQETPAPMTPPRIAIGLPVHNGEPLLTAALDSWLAQDWDDFELIVSDNASTDGTEAVCRRYADADPRIRYHRQEVNRGAVHNFNHTFHLASSPYFTWAAHDDVVEPGFLRRCLEVLEEDASVVLSYPLVDYVDLEGEPTGRATPPLELRDPDPAQRLRALLDAQLDLPYPVFGLMRRDAAARTGLIRSNKGSDRTLLAELCLLGRFRQVPEVLLHYRDHPPASRERTRAWWDPANRTRLSVRTLTLLRQHHEAIWATALPRRDKLRLSAAAMDHFLVDNRTRLAGDVKQTVYHLLSRCGLEPRVGR